ncbi:cell division transport system permease protein [Filimonas zeae]|uniref:Cell division protein FtsX n=1 Tax=Filimonas zeae TaxID=1737353 RepID=A0A917J191_9BACT|nr:permease-like cell division protein FtsX [Filimonas zeae]MDR6341170.1 cell division transport system permease protein [Filimonas zeae]GGH76948.1 cell division protein FtsX [Filimonas zeae]
MAQFGKLSARRGKPSYIYSITGVAIVLLIMGIMGWIFLNFSQASNTFKEDIRISAYLRTLNKDSIAQIQQFISSQPFAKDVKYINKETAKEIWNKENNEDWSKFLDFNPLPESIDFYTRAQYVNNDSLKKISNTLMTAYGNQITDLQYPQNLVNSLNERASKLGVVFLVVAVVLCVIIIVSIDTTIRLAMFSNRFLIKTMQMVGATRGFIVKPMDLRAIANGLISSLIAIGILFGLIQWAETQFPQLKAIRNTQLTLILFGGMIIIGVGISLFSTHRSVMKYLKMKLDDLY